MDIDCARVSPAAKRGRSPPPAATLPAPAHKPQPLGAREAALASLGVNAKDTPRANRVTDATSPAKPRPPPTAEPVLPNAAITQRAYTWHRGVQWPASPPTTAGGGACAANSPGRKKVLHNRFVDNADVLESLLGGIPADATRVFIAVGPWAVDAWRDCLGDEQAQAALVRDAVVEAFFVDVDAVPEATDLLAISTPHLPSAHVFHMPPVPSVGPDGGIAAAAPTKCSEKLLAAPIDLTSLLCIEPVHGIAHLHRRMLRAQCEKPDHCTAAIVVVYSGATWCPPCCRVMPHVPSMVRGLAGAALPKGVHLTVVKVDRDACGATDAVYGVALIPTFQVFDAQHATADRCNSPALHALPLAAPPCHDDRALADSPEAAEWLRLMGAAREAAVKPLAVLQNSQAGAVQAFIERHSAPLAFDDDF